jgi:hypothetical protein
VIHYEINDVSFLQAQLGYRAGYKARRMRLEAMPLDQHIAGRHGEGEADDSYSNAFVIGTQVAMNF